MSDEMMTAGGDRLFDTGLAPTIRSGMEFAQRLATVSREGVRMMPGASEVMARTALRAALASVTAALASATAQCRRASPPADIEAITDGSGRMIYRCSHPSPHSWTLDGNPLP